MSNPQDAYVAAAVLLDQIEMEESIDNLRLLATKVVTTMVQALNACDEAIETVCETRALVKEQQDFIAEMADVILKLKS